MSVGFSDMLLKRAALMQKADCPLCGETQATWHALYDHLVKKHCGTKSPRTIGVCFFCGGEFKDDYEVVAHLEKFRGDALLAHVIEEATAYAVTGQTKSKRLMAELLAIDPEHLDALDSAIWAQSTNAPAPIVHWGASP